MEKVYCSNCMYYLPSLPFTKGACNHPNNRGEEIVLVKGSYKYAPVYGYRHKKHPSKLNRNNNCTYYKYIGWI